MSTHATNKRPVHLDLFKIRLPVPGAMSIVHRLTGLLLFLATPVLIYSLDQSLISAAGFQRTFDFLHAPLGMGLLFILMWSLTHHLLAGIRYLLIDVDLGVEKPVARASAFVVLLASPPLALLLTWGLL